MNLFDSFPEQLQQRQWVPLVTQLVDAANESSHELADLLESMPSVGRYRLIALIGHGGMARVFAAWDSTDCCPVAIKLFEPKHEEVWSLIQRFQNEASALGKLAHPHIVSLLDRGNKKGRMYLVMNLVIGPSWSDIFRLWRFHQLGSEGDRGQVRWAASSLGRQSESSRISLSSSSICSRSHSRGSNSTSLHSELHQSSAEFDAEHSASIIPKSLMEVVAFSGQHFSTVAEIGRQVCDALRYSHAQGILHRDIKPSNLLLDDEGKTWVMDFGLASVSWSSAVSSGDRLTRYGDLLGTIPYMSVGAVEGNYSEQSDLYALGATLFELATLRAVWQGFNESDILKKLFEGSLPSWDRLHDCGVPNELAKVIICLLNSENSQAKLSADQMYDSFESLADGGPARLPQETQGWLLRSKRWAGHWIQRREWRIGAAIWLGMIAIFAGVMGFKLYSEHRVLATKATSLRNTLQSRLDQAVYSVQLLKQFAENVDEFNEENFASFAKPVLENNREVVSVGLAKGAQRLGGGERDNLPTLGTAVVTQMEPQVNPETHLGLGFDLMSEDLFRDALKQTDFSGDTTVAGPIMLSGLGPQKSAFVLTQRLEHLNKATSFVFVMIRTDQLLKSLKLPKQDDRLLVRIWPDRLRHATSIYEGDQRGVSFKIPDSEFAPDFEFDLRIRSSRWKLSLSLANPWAQSNASLFLKTFAFAIVLPLPMVLLKRGLSLFRRSAPE